MARIREQRCGSVHGVVSDVSTLSLLTTTMTRLPQRREQRHRGCREQPRVPHAFQRNFHCTPQYLPPFLAALHCFVQRQAALDASG